MIILYIFRYLECLRHRVLLVHPQVRVLGILNFLIIDFNLLIDL